MTDRTQIINHIHKRGIVCFVALLFTIVCAERSEKERGIVRNIAADYARDGHNKK